MNLVIHLGEQVDLGALVSDLDKKFDFTLEEVLLNDYSKRT